MFRSVVYVSWTSGILADHAGLRQPPSGGANLQASAVAWLNFGLLHAWT